MKVGFIGLGRMGQVMSRRLVEAGHEVAAYNRTADKAKALAEFGVKAVGSIKAAATSGEAVFTMLANDAAVMEVVNQPGGLKESLPRGGIHICAGTHSVATIQELKALHAKAGQVLIASPVLGRPLFTAIARRCFEAGADPASAAAIKIANNFVLGCAIEALGEGFALVRKYEVAPEVFYDVLTDILF